MRRTPLGRFLAPVPWAIRDHLNVAELLRIAAAAIVSGAGVDGLLAALRAHVGSFVAPADAALAAAVLTLLIEVVRRLGHGRPAPVR